MRNILVADDEEMVRFVLTEKLGEHGFSVIAVPDGASAVEAFHRDIFDSVLLDLKMPGMDGIETMLEIRKISTDIPIIIVTAYGDIPTAVEAIKLGAYDFVEKPPQISRIVVTLKRAMERRELEREVLKLGIEMNAKSELQAAFEKLKELDRLKTDFIASISHELLTPLTSILGFVKVIDKKLADAVLPVVPLDNTGARKAIEQIRQSVEIITSESSHLSDLVNNVLDLSKLESGDFAWRTGAYRIESVIKAALMELSSEIAQKGLQSAAEVVPSLPEMRGDEQRMVRVLTNLISNAIKFTEHGSVTVRAGLFPGNSRMMQVSVIDTGIGIAPEDQGKLFKKFHQLGEMLTNKPHGMGLGLRLCKEIVEHHGGRIWVESAVGSGSTFSFTLPIQSS